MIVKIGENVQLRAETNYWTLERKVVVQDHPRAKAQNVGTIRWDPVGHYGDLKTAGQQLLLRHFQLLTDEVGPKAIRDIQDLVDAIVDGAQLIATACEEAKQEKPAA